MSGSHFHALGVACRCGLAVFEEKLFAVGGFGGSYLSPVETLSSATGAWVPAANTLNAARLGCVGATRP